MPAYRYRALSRAGELVRGELEAESPGAAAAGLQRRGLLVVRVDPARRGLGFLQAELGGGARLLPAELAYATRELASMLGAGQDLDQSLRFMAEGAARRRVAAVWGRVRDQVRDGASLAVALQGDARSFPRLYVGLVRAGEAGGDLAGTLERLASLLERQRSLNATIQSALIYPAILVVAAVGSIMLLLTRVLPEFVPLFAENGVPLPPSTAFLLGVGNAVSEFALPAVALLVAGALGVRALLRRPALRLVADGFLLKIPVAGGLLRDVLAARFSRTLGSLLNNGVPLLAALGVAQDVIGNHAARGAVAQAADAARHGQSVARALQASSVFPPRLAQLLRLGEDTAQLGPMAARAADIFEEQARLGAQRLVALLVPAITIAMGAAVAGIVSSLLLAMLSLNDIAQ